MTSTPPNQKATSRTLGGFFHGFSKRRAKAAGSLAPARRVVFTLFN